MNKIQEVKERADIIKVAEYFGIRAKQCCPFHNEKNPSFSISQSRQVYKCFSCGSGGDVISLVSNLLNINAYEAAKQINHIFSLRIDFGKPTSKYEVNKYIQKRKTEEAFKKWELETFILLTDTFHILKKWITIGDFESEKFATACIEQDYIEYIIDSVFIEGTNEDKIQFWKKGRGYIDKCKQILQSTKNPIRLQKLRKG